MRPLCQRGKGFTLIEVILALGISSIVVISTYSLLDFSRNACIKGEIIDNLLLNGRYAIEYIKDDIREADRIISTDKFSGLNILYPSNVGFVILKIDENQKPEEYRFITYYMKNDKIVRLSCNRFNDKYPGQSYFDGSNNLCEYVGNIANTKFDPIHKLIYLDFIFNHINGEELRLKSDVYIRCPIDY